MNRSLTRSVTLSLFAVLGIAAGCGRSKGGGSGQERAADPMRTSKGTVQEPVPGTKVGTSNATDQGPGASQPVKSEGGGTTDPASSNPASSNPNGSPTSNNPTSSVQPGSGSGFQSSAYFPVVGDEWVMSTRSKVWKSGGSEPEWGSNTTPDVAYSISATYKPGLSCKARLARQVGPDSSESDYSCGDLDKPFSCGGPTPPPSACEEETVVEMGQKDIGEWKGAFGSKTICRTVSPYVVPKDSFIVRHTETTTWRSNDALAADRIVLIESRQCSIEGLATKAEGAKSAIPDVCNATNKNVGFSRSETYLKSQKKGSGAKMLNVENRMEFSASGATLVPAVKQRLTTTCTFQPGKAPVGQPVTNQGLIVSAVQKYCDAKGVERERRLFLGPVPKGGYPSPTSIPVDRFGLADAMAASTSGTNDLQEFKPELAGNCKATALVDGSAKEVSGAVDCGGIPLKSSSGSSTATISGVTFTCLAPEGYLP